MVFCLFLACPHNTENILMSYCFTGPYLVVITKKTKVGELNGNDVWKVAGTELLSYKRTTLHMNEQQASITFSQVKVKLSCCKLSCKQNLTFLRYCSLGNQVTEPSYNKHR